jgi:hypothetical protein
MINGSRVGRNSVQSPIQLKTLGGKMVITEQSVDALDAVLAYAAP